jgi:hypothetical protein
MTYDDLEDKTITEQVKEWTGGNVGVGTVPWCRPLTVF